MNERWHFPKVTRREVDNFGLMYGGSIGMNYIAYADVTYGRYTKLIRILYDRRLNMFYDVAGHRLTNVFEFITPNDLYLHRNDPGETIFPHRNDPSIMCEIITEEEWWDFPADADYIGDYADQCR